MTPKKNLHIIKCPHSLEIEESFLILFVSCVVTIINHTHTHTHSPTNAHNLYIMTNHVCVFVYIFVCIYI
jgi:hypothetical protein